MMYNEAYADRWEADRQAEAEWAEAEWAEMEAQYAEDYRHFIEAMETFN